MAKAGQPKSTADTFDVTRGNNMTSRIAEMTIDLTIEGQPDVCKRMRAEGGVFEFDSEIGCVFFTCVRHGPRFRVLSLDKMTLMASSAFEIGTQITLLLNGGNHNAGK